LVAAAKFLVAAVKNLFVVPNFVAVTKPFFFRVGTLEINTQAGQFYTSLRTNFRII